MDQKEGVQNDSSQLCEVCKERPYKYTCPKCSLNYCSVACFKNHKSGCIEKENSAGIQRNGVRQNEDDSDSSDSGDDIIDSLIPRDRLERIKDSASIRELLNEPFIQKAIIKIMRSDNKEKALMELRDNSEMSILIDELLLCVGVAKRRDDGSIEFLYL